MHEPLDRRTFLRRAGALGLVAPALHATGCTDEREPPDPDAAPSAAGALDRPVLRPWGDGAVRIDSPPRQLPMAYVSMGLRQVFVDRPFRDLASRILGAHISVSTGVWRIPLPGDPVGEPITPGDLLREFEELDSADWDPAMEPALGDFRIVRGRPREVRVDFDCAPVAYGGGWVSAGPWPILRCDGVGEEPCREDLTDVGEGRRHPLRGCLAEADPVRVLAWVCPA